MPMLHDPADSLALTPRLNIFLYLNLCQFGEVIKGREENKTDSMTKGVEEGLPAYTQIFNPLALYKPRI